MSQSGSRRRSGLFLWGNVTAVSVGAFFAFLYASAGTALVPSSAFWTGALLCGSGMHLSNTNTNYSYGTTHGTSTDFSCDGAGTHTTVSTWAIFGLQFLGALVVMLLLMVVANVVVRRRQRSRGEARPPHTTLDVPFAFGSIGQSSGPAGVSFATSVGLSPDQDARVRQALSALGEGGPVQAIVFPQTTPSSASDSLSQLERLSALHNSGALTDAEFEQEKLRIIGAQ